MRRTKRRLKGALMALGLAGILGLGAPAGAEGEIADPISAEARGVIRQIFEAQSAERRHRDAMADLGRAVREVRLRLREIAIGAPSRGLLAETQLLGSTTERARSLLREIRRDAAGEEAVALAQVQARLDELATRAADVAAAKSDTERVTKAGALVGELEVSFPRAERVDPGPRRQPTGTFAAPSGDLREGD